MSEAHDRTGVQAKIISKQASCGAAPSRIVRLLAYEAALRDVAGTTAQHIALSLSRLDPAPEPSFATSPRIGATRRISAPGEEAAGIWQMAPTSGSTPASPSGPTATSAPASDGGRGPCEQACTPLSMSSRAESLDQLDGDNENGGRSGELTAQAVSMHDPCERDESSASGATGEVSEAATRAASTHAEEGGPPGDVMREMWDAMEAAVADGVDDGDATGARAGCGEPVAADACVQMQRVSAVHAAVPERSLAAAVPLRTFPQPAPRLRTTTSSVCSQDYGAGTWWKVPVDTHVEVPADDSIRVGADGHASPGRRGQRLRRAARCATAGVAVVAVRLLFGKRRNAQ